MQELKPFDFGVRVTIHGFVVNQYKSSMIELVVVLNTADTDNQMIQIQTTMTTRILKLLSYEYPLFTSNIKNFS